MSKDQAEEPEVLFELDIFLLGGCQTRMTENSQVLYYHNMHEALLCLPFPFEKFSALVIHQWMIRKEIM
jgi:hypothetical protein